MKSLVKILGKTNVGIFLRNFFNYKPVHMSIDRLKLISVSDAFAWRTDNNFKTIFKYSDILNIFYKIKNSWIEFHFYDKDNNLLKIEKKEKPHVPAKRPFRTTTTLPCFMILPILQRENRTAKLSPEKIKS
jgi:hypothetical protein